MLSVLTGADSDASFTATVQAKGADAPWTALIRFSNGGEFVIELDPARHRGEFRPIEQYKFHVLSAMIALFMPR